MIIAPHRTTKLDTLPYLQITIKEILGEGTFGKVYKVTNKGHTYAMKILKKSNKTAYKYLKEEALVMTLISASPTHCHPLFICYHGVYNTIYGTGILMEYFKGRSLFYLYEALQNKGIGLSTLDACRLLQYLLEGISYLHSLDIVHRDIKDENILYSTTKIKIIDMGISCYVGTDAAINVNLCDKPKGTPLFMAPELFDGIPIKSKQKFSGIPEKYGKLVTKNPAMVLKAADIWAIAATVWELITMQEPPDARIIKTHLDIIKLATNQLSNVSNSVRCLITMMMNPNPTLRITAADALTLLGNVQPYFDHYE